MPGIDIFLTMIPPGLSLCLSVGLIYSQSRLKRHKITAIKAELINAAGRTKAVMFDKTGTLTSDKVTLHQVLLADIHTGGYQILDSRIQAASHRHARLYECVALNNTLIHDPWGELQGDPIEKELAGMASGQVLRKDDYKVLNIFEFNPALKRMSVVVQHKDTGKNILLTKGAPEIIIGLSNISGRQRESWLNGIEEYTQKGMRGLAIASKELGSRNIDVGLSDEALGQR